MIFRALLFAMTLFLSVDVVNAADNKPVENQRLCRTEDLMGGTWKLMQMVETPPRKEAAWYRDIPFHYLAFHLDHSYAYIASTQEFKKPIDVQNALLWTEKGKHDLQFTLDDQGVLNLFVDKTPKYSYRCLTIKATQAGYVKGDLILTGYTRKARSQMYKLYRRWF
jgi:hypothetical protein